MEGEEPDVYGSTRVDFKAEHEAYLGRAREIYGTIRSLMAEVMRCPDADLSAAARNRSAPINELARELDRYAGTRPTMTAAREHADRLRPIIVRWKSIDVDPAQAERFGDPTFEIPRAIRSNWCPN